MSWLTLLLCASVVFLSRYLLTDPRLPLRLSQRGQLLLSYSAPAVLTAIAAPLVLVHDQSLDLTPANPYLVASLLVAIVARAWGRPLLAVGCGMVLFYLWR